MKHIVWRVLPVIAALLSPLPGAAQDSPTLSLEVWGGGIFGGDRLGNTDLIEAGGFMTLDEPDSGPLVGAGLSLSPLPLGLRPYVRLLYALPADVDARWTPCHPGVGCPAVLLEPDARTSRLHATAGLDVDVLGSGSPIRPRLSAGVGLRHLRLDWDGLPDAAPSLALAPGAHGETDLLLQLGAEATVPMNRWELVARVSADFSDFGAGRVPDVVAPTTGIDLGRRNDEVYTVSLGVRRALW